MSQENTGLYRLCIGGLVGAVALLCGAVPAEGAFPGRNGRIAYLDSYGGISSVWASGVGRQRVVRRHGGAPEYSPRGDRLAFSRFYVLSAEPNPIVSRFELSRLELVRKDGRERTVLTTGADDYSPAWAPNGRRIAFARSNPCDKYYNAEADCPPKVQQDKKYGILIRRRDGRTRVVTRMGWDPVWSPDGKLILYTDLRDGSLDAIKPDGGNARPVVRRSAFGGHDWSPDGRRIVFSSGSGEDSYIGVVRRDGTGFRRVVGNGEAPAYSPDGRWIVFVRPDHRNFDQRRCNDTSGQSLWAVAAGGGQARMLRYRSGDPICGAGPDWQPLR
jgi:Tol biopolymer transport system component